MRSILADVQPLTHPGIAGGAPGSGSATDPATVASLYSPANDVGSRWSALADSLIARLYHSTAFLTPNAEVSRRLHTMLFDGP